MDGRGLALSVTDANQSTLSYGYDAFGNLAQVKDPNGNTTTMRYDVLGHKLGQTDPDMGSWSYRYDSLGELKTQQDAKNQTISYDYDALGRMKDRTDPVTYRSWTWDTVWIGALTSEATYPVSNHSTATSARTLGYTAFGAVNSDSQLIDGSTYVTQAQYDTQGRIVQLTYPGGFAVAQHYNAYGAQDLLYPPSSPGCASSPPTNCTYYWTATVWDEWGKVADETLGNSAYTTTTRDPAVGLVRDLSAAYLNLYDTLAK